MGERATDHRGGVARRPVLDELDRGLAPILDEAVQEETLLHPGLAQGRDHTPVDIRRHRTEPPADQRDRKRGLGLPRLTDLIR